MNFETLKNIYYFVLEYKNNIRYLEDDEYILSGYYTESKSKKDVVFYKGGMIHGIRTIYSMDGAKILQQQYEMGVFIRTL